MDLDSLLQIGKNKAKSFAKQQLAKLGKKLGKKILLKLLANPYVLGGILAVLGILILVICIWGVFFSVPKDYETEEGQLAFFTTLDDDPEWNLKKDKELQAKYVELANNGYDKIPDMSFGSKDVAPYQMSPFNQASIYKISWALIAGTDRVLGDPVVGDGIHRKPNPEKVYAAIGPRFAWKDTTVQVERCRPRTRELPDGTEETYTACDKGTYKTQLITSVDQYDKTMAFTYKTVTETYGEGEKKTTVIREVVDKITTTPRELDRLTAYLVDNGLIADDAEFVVELAKNYDPSFVDILFGSGGSHLGDEGYVSTQIPAEFVPIYQAAAKKYGIPWQILAAIHRVETTFSTDPTMVSSAGAIGHMQFMPATWVGWTYDIGGGLVSPNLDITNLDVIRAGGGYGEDANGDGKADPWDIQDAIFSAAHYLAANGYNSDPRKAIRAYNKADWYVDEVMTYLDLFQQPEPVWANAVYPVERGKYRVSSPFAVRQDPFTGETKNHKGIDLAAAAGVPVRAPLDGIVAFVGVKSGYGNTIIVDHGNGVQTLYGHLLDGSTKVKAKQTVKAGQQIAGVGSTGKSTGNHLHFEIHIDGTPVNPAEYMNF